MQPEIEVEITNTQSHLRLEPAAIDHLVRLVLTAQDRPRASISIAVVDNATIHTINQAHLGHDCPTDVITFPLAEPDEPMLAGELVISAEMACDWPARELGVEPRDELALYVVHGLLHLCGHDDRDDSARRRMREREDELLSLAGIANPYAREVATPPGPSGNPAAGSRLLSKDSEGPPWTD